MDVCSGYPAGSWFQDASTGLKEGAAKRRAVTWALHLRKQVTRRSKLGPIFEPWRVPLYSLSTIPLGANLNLRHIVAGTQLHPAIGRVRMFGRI